MQDKFEETEKLNTKLKTDKKALEDDKTKDL